MKLLRKIKQCEHRSRRSGANISIYLGAIFILVMVAAAEAVTSHDGLSVHASGLNIKLQLSAPEGPRLLVKLVRQSRH